MSYVHSSYLFVLVHDGEDAVDRFAGRIPPSQCQTDHPCVLERGVARQYVTTHKLARALEVVFSCPAASINLWKRALEAVTMVVQTRRTIQKDSLGNRSTIVRDKVKYNNNTGIEFWLNYLG